VVGTTSVLRAPTPATMGPSTTKRPQKSGEERGYCRRWARKLWSLRDHLWILRVVEAIDDAKPTEFRKMPLTCAVKEASTNNGPGHAWSPGPSSGRLLMRSRIRPWRQRAWQQRAWPRQEPLQPQARPLPCRPHQPCPCPWPCSQTAQSPERRHTRHRRWREVGQR
jgi:hypothetical protein